MSLCYYNWNNLLLSKYYVQSLQSFSLSTLFHFFWLLLFYSDPTPPSGEDSCLFLINGWHLVQRESGIMAVTDGKLGRGGGRGCVGVASESRQ